MAHEPNKTLGLFAAAYARFTAGDPTEMMQFLADDVLYHLPGKHLGGGIVRGKSALLTRIAKTASWFNRPPKVTLLKTFAAEEFIATVEHLLAQHRSIELDQTVLVVWRMHEDKCVEIWSHFSDQDFCDQFWSGFKL